MSEIFDTGSPKWSWPTKLVVGISIVALAAGLLIQFREYVGPLLVVFILTYLSYPVARYLNTRLHMSWRLSVTLFYLVLILILLGLLALGGLALIEQGQSLVNFLQNAQVNISEFIAQLSTQVITISPHLQIDMRKLKDLTPITDQILSAVQPLLKEVGNLLGMLATGAANVIGWIAFIILISYFITAESHGRRGMIHVEIPGYAGDFRRLGVILDNTWNAFLRGQFVLFMLTIMIYAIILTALGVRFALGLAVLTGFGRFLPYVGPFIAWVTMGLVAYFQGYTMFGLSPLVYVGLVIGLSILIDSAFDNIVSPKFMGSTLKVHPAGVLLTALIAAKLIGVIGLLLAAPVLATFQLLLRYVLRKMFDLDPWAGTDVVPVRVRQPMIPPFITKFFANFGKRVQAAIKRSPNA